MKEMLVNVSAGHERRLAIVSDGVLEELYIERESEDSHVGNIYKGRVTNIEPSIQAAFIDFGGARNGFLHISDLQAQYFPKNKRVEEPVGRKASRKDRPPIQDCLRRGQELIVQVIKSGIGTKGPTLTTYLSVPGRFLVMMPGMTKFGVSRKIEDDDTRGELRGLIEQIETPEGLGFIVRTAGLGRSKRDLQQDLKYLQRLWRSVESRIRKHRAPAEVFQESDMVIRTIRDVYSSEIKRIICDESDMAEKITEFLRVAMPRTPNKVMMYTGKVPLFDRYGLEDEIERIYSRRVEMPGGASLVIDQAEALVAIDVNSGKNRSNDNAEETAYRINLQAAREVARQLRLRDMGGVIVIDFIDMRYERHQRDIERVLREQVKRDRAKTKILKLSRFGLIEMTRQRMRPSLKRSMFSECANCNGQGLIKSDESLGLSVIRTLQLACTDSRIVKIVLTVPHRVSDYLNNRRRTQIVELESNFGKKITIITDANLAGDEVRVECFDDRDGLINWLPDPESRNPMPSAPADAPIKLIRKPPTDKELVDITEFDEKSLDDEQDGEPTDQASLVDQTQVDDDADADEAAQDEPRENGKSRRRRRRRRKSKSSDQTPQAEGQDDGPTTTPSEDDKHESTEPNEVRTEDQDGTQAEHADGEAGEDKPRSKRRRRRGGRRRRSKQQGGEGQDQPQTTTPDQPQASDASDQDNRVLAEPRSASEAEVRPAEAAPSETSQQESRDDHQAEAASGSTRRSRRRRSGKKAVAASAAAVTTPAADGDVEAGKSAQAEPPADQSETQTPSPVKAVEAPDETPTKAAVSDAPAEARTAVPAAKESADDEQADKPAAKTTRKKKAAKKKTAKKATRKKAAKTAQKAAKETPNASDDASGSSAKAAKAAKKKTTRKTTRKKSKTAKKAAAASDEPKTDAAQADNE